MNWKRSKRYTGNPHPIVVKELKIKEDPSNFYDLQTIKMVFRAITAISVLLFCFSSMILVQAFAQNRPMAIGQLLFSGACLTAVVSLGRIASKMPDQP
jgi:hypothetical protein